MNKTESAYAQLIKLHHKNHSNNDNTHQAFISIPIALNPNSIRAESFQKALALRAKNCLK